MATKRKKPTTTALTTTPKAQAMPRVVRSQLSADARTTLACIETMNPLRGLTASGAQNLFDSARSGDTTRLQWLYNEIEGAIPAMLICAERRASAIAGYDWHIAERDHIRKGHENLRAEQAAALNDAFADIDQTNFSGALEHLSSAFFRGFAHVSPLWSADHLTFTGFDLLDNWNVVRNAIHEPTIWRWNPSATATMNFDALPEIPPDELVSLVRPRHIDYPALQISLRVALGDRTYGRFIDRYGIPPVIVIMPPDTDPTKTGLYLSETEKVADGGSGVLPYGSLVNYAAGGRGVDPFTAFIERQEKTIVLLGTGGMLTSLVEATGLGGGASAAHSDTWREIVQRDVRFVGEAVSRQLASPILERAFPGQPHLAYFAFDQDPTPTADELFETAIKAKNAGYLILQSELEEKSGFKLEKDTSQGMGAAYNVMNSSAVPEIADLSNGKTRENAPKAPEAEREPPEAENAVERILDGFADILSEKTNEAMTKAAAEKEDA